MNWIGEEKKMKLTKNNLVALALMIGISLVTVFAQDYGANRGEIRTLLNQIEVKSDTFKYQLDRAMYSTVNNPRAEANINQIVTSFEDSVDRMKQNYSSRRDISNDLRDVLAKANQIDNFLRQYRFDPQTQNSWRLLKTDLNSLSNFYNSNGGWNNSYSNALNGTFRLNVNQSDNLSSVIDRALYDVNYYQREKMRNNLQRRLAVPEYLAIERTNRTIKMASSNANQTSFEANGRPNTEYLSNGRTMTNTVTLTSDKFIISSDGDRVNAFYISFEPFSNGQRLKVTRRLHLENRNQTITVSSVYDKTSNVPNWNLYRNDGYNYPNNDNDNNDYGNNNYGNNSFYLKNGTQLVATLNNNLSTEQNSEGQRFSMTVISPSSHYGAIIEGTVSKANRSGRFSGRAQLSLNFETIRFRNGRTYRFEGLIDSITGENGKTIKVDNENAVNGSSQIKDTVIRSGIGAAIGAIIGGIAGGGKGAAIGAAIGAGAGGGSVVVQGRDDIELNEGTTFNLTASSTLR